MTTLNFIYTLIAVSVLTGKNAALPVLPILGTVKDVISFGINVYSFFDSILGEDETHATPAPIDYDRIINRISERIEMSTETIVFKLELQAYLSELRNVAHTVKQLLAEMEDIVKTKTKDTREELQRRFRNNFERHKTDIYKVKSLLTFKVDVSGISSTLLSLIANEFKCRMSSLEQFQNYYMALVSDVVALALLNEKLSEKSLYSETVDSWKTAINSLFDDMEVQKNACRAKFVELATEDFSRINDPSELFKNLQSKYSYRETDVLYLGGSYCVWSLKAYDKILQKVKDNTMTFVFMSGEENVQSVTSKQFQKIVSVAKFENCIDDKDTKVISFFDVLGKDLVFWLMYPQEQNADFQILLDQSSTAGTITIESGGTKYKTVVYLREQDDSTNSTLTAGDYDVKFYEKPVSVGVSFSLKTWQLGVIIGVSILVVVN